MESTMFCYQCQETAGCSGCTKSGVCGKTPETANLQDLLVFATRNLSRVTSALRAEGAAVDARIDRMVTENLFVTITNANFDNDVIRSRISQTVEATNELAGRLEGTAPDTWDGSGDWGALAREVGVLRTENEDVRSLRELITYGLKGMAAYNHHVNAYGKSNPEVDAFIQEALAKVSDDGQSIDQLIALTLETGKYGVEGMALLDRANTGAYGNPEITKVEIGVRKNPGILISGHDLRDLEMLLEQTAGTGVDVYTHSEMLPAHYYPAFKKYGAGCCAPSCGGPPPPFARTPPGARHPPRPAACPPGRTGRPSRSKDGASLQCARSRPTGPSARPRARPASRSPAPRSPGSGPLSAPPGQAGQRLSCSVRFRARSSSNTEMFAAIIPTTLLQSGEGPILFHSYIIISVTRNRAKGQSAP